MVKKLQRWFITGLILLTPTYITIIVLRWLFGHVDGPIRNFIAERLHGPAIPGVGVLATLLIIVLAGALASTLLVRSALGVWERVLHNIPFIRTLYSGIKQLLSPFSPEESAQFQRVVIVEWPSSGLYSLGFLVKPEACVSPDGVMMSSVLLPSNHLHLGNVVLIPDERIHPVDMSIEQGLKFLVSMGAALDRPIVLRRPALPPQPAG